MTETQITLKLERRSRFISKAQDMGVAENWTLAKYLIGLERTVENLQKEVEKLKESQNG